MRNILCVVAHPDDEVLGVGGTLARHAMRGDNVVVVIVCGNVLRIDGVDWKTQAIASLTALGVKSINHKLLGLPDQKLDRYAFLSLEQAVREALVGQYFDIVYTHWHKDLNRDHRIVNEVVQLIARPKTGRSLEVLEFPTPSSTEYSRETFAPDTWIDITKSLDKKLMAMSCYEQDLQVSPLTRNNDYLMALARVKGGKVGLTAAEIFCTARRIIS